MSPCLSSVSGSVSGEKHHPPLPTEVQASRAKTFPPKDSTKSEENGKNPFNFWGVETSKISEIAQLASMISMDTKKSDIYIYVCV